MKFSEVFHQINFKIYTLIKFKVNKKSKNNRILFKNNSQTTYIHKQSVIITLTNLETIIFIS